MLSENNRDAKECWLILMLMLDFVDGVHTVHDDEPEKIWPKAYTYYICLSSKKQLL